MSDSGSGIDYGSITLRIKRIATLLGRAEREMNHGLPRACVLEAIEDLHNLADEAATNSLGRTEQESVGTSDRSEILMSLRYRPRSPADIIMAMGGRPSARAELLSMWTDGTITMRFDGMFEITKEKSDETGKSVAGKDGG